VGRNLKIKRAKEEHYKAGECVWWESLLDMKEVSELEERKGEDLQPRDHNKRHEDAGRGREIG
jgi:hypothetical protein